MSARIHAPDSIRHGFHRGRMKTANPIELARRAEIRAERTEAKRTRMLRLADTYNRWLVRERVLRDDPTRKAEHTKARGQLEAARRRMDNAGRGRR